MVLIMVTVWYPPNKSTEVTKKYFEVMKKFPAASFAKMVVNAVKTSWDKEGVVAMEIAEIEKGKYEEEMNLIMKRMNELTGIEGVRYRVETLITFEQAFALMGVVPPK
jgi:hypothetical protein